MDWAGRDLHQQTDILWVKNDPCVVRPVHWIQKYRVGHGLLPGCLHVRFVHGNHPEALLVLQELPRD